MFLSEVILEIIIGATVLSGVSIERLCKEEKYVKKIYFGVIVGLIVIGYILIKTMLQGYLWFETQYEGLMFINICVQVIKLFVIVFILAVIVLTIEYLKVDHILTVEYLVLILFSLLALLYLLSALDLLMMYLLLELQALSLYIIAAYKVGSTKSTEAGLKYFLIGSLASIMYLLGVSLIYCDLGTTNLEIIHGLNIVDVRVTSISLVFVVSGLLFKMAAAPFHVWIADVYDGAITVATAFFSIIPKLVLAVLVARLIDIFEICFQWERGSLFLLCIAILSVIVGALTALYQIGIKRLIAYSAIVHIGFIILGCSTGSVMASAYVIVYMVTYSILLINFFAIILGLRRGVEKIEIDKLRDLKGFLCKNSFLIGIMAINLFSLAGVPPLAGFYGKFFMLLLAIEVKIYYGALVFVALSVISAFYYIRVISVIMYEKYEYWILSGVFTKVASYIISFTFILNIVWAIFLEKVVILCGIY